MLGLARRKKTAIIHIFCHFIANNAMWVKQIDRQIDTRIVNVTDPARTDGAISGDDLLAVQRLNRFLMTKDVARGCELSGFAPNPRIFWSISSALVGYAGLAVAIMSEPFGGVGLYPWLSRRRLHSRSDACEAFRASRFPLWL
jgi:hypothetical protein